MPHILRRRIRPLAVLPLLFGVMLVAAIACGSTETVVQTVVVEKQVPGAKVVETVIVEKQVPGAKVVQKVVETVVVEKRVPVEKKVVETVIVEKKVAGKTVKVVETVLVEKPVTRVEKVVETVVVEKQVPVEKKVVETVVVEKLVVATPTAAPAAPPKLPSGNVTVATNTVGVPVGTPELCVPGCGNEKYLMSGWDTLTRAAPDGTTVGQIAESWEFSPDLTSITWHIRPGIEFNKGWGPLTARDVAWTVNSINGATNPDSIHDNVGDFAGSYGETTVVDDMTAVTAITNFDSRAPKFLWSGFWQGVAISSKAVFDKFGKKGMIDVFVGSGPFEVEEWVDDSHISLKAVQNHWYKTPDVATAKILEVPEESARIAMFETGEAEITRVALRNIPRLLLAGGKTRSAGTSGNTISFGGGQFLEKTNINTGEPLVSPGFDPSLPWVGDPDAAGCDRAVLSVSVPSGPICDELENARKVREALAMSIDRDAINDSLYNGLADPNYMTHLSIKNPVFKDEWKIPLDVEKAKTLLAEAGYGDGFTVTLNAGEGPDALELPAAVTSIWQNELGIKVQYNRTSYSVVRPTYVARTNKNLLIGGWTTSWPVDWPQGREDNSMFDGGTMKYGALPFSAITQKTMMSEPDKAKRVEMAIAWYENENFWKWQPGVIDVPIFDVFNADKMTWNQQRGTSIWWGGVAVAFPLEDVVLK